MDLMLEKNLEVLKEKHPRIAETINQISISEDRRFIVNEKNVIVYQQLHHEKWICLTSTYKPVNEAQRQTSNPDISETKFVFVLGEAGLYHIEALLSRVSKDAIVLLLSNRLDN